MALTINNYQRPLDTVQENVTFTVKPETLEYLEDPENTYIFRQRYTIDGLNPQMFQAEASGSESTTLLQGVIGAFANVRVGDAVMGVPAIPADTRVVAIDSANSTLTLSNALTANFAAQMVTFGPPIFDVTAFIIEVVLEVQSTGLQIKTQTYTFDGSQSIDSDADNDDELTTAQATNAANPATALALINIDQILTNVRIPRS